MGAKDKARITNPRQRVCLWDKYWFGWIGVGTDCKSAPAVEVFGVWFLRHFSRCENLGFRSLGFSPRYDLREDACFPNFLR